MKIALVDDELNQLLHLKKLLASQLDTLIPEASHLIDTYRSGQSFLDHWTAGQYDVIILDIFMGGITGVEVAKEIRRTDRDVKLVFCSHSNEFATESYEVNARYYLLKPATPGSITNMLQRLNLEMIQLQEFVTLPDGHDVMAAAGGGDGEFLIEAQVNGVQNLAVADDLGMGGSVPGYQKPGTQP